MDLQNTNMRDAHASNQTFSCNNIARIGLQNTTNMRDACEQSDVSFATMLQGWIYKTQTCVMHASNQKVFLCNKTQQTRRANFSI
jgi:hypothetical protein